MLEANTYDGALLVKSIALFLSLVETALRFKLLAGAFTSINNMSGGFSLKTIGFSNRLSYRYTVFLSQVQSRPKKHENSREQH